MAKTILRLGDTWAFERLQIYIRELERHIIKYPLKLTTRQEIYYEEDKRNVIALKTALGWYEELKCIEEEEINGRDKN